MANKLARTRSSALANAGDGPKAVTTTVGIGLTLEVAGEPVTLSSPNVADPKNLELTLSNPVALPDVKTSYTSLQAGPLKPILPDVNWDNDFAKKIGQIQTTIDQFYMNTGTGELAVGMTFTFDWEFLPDVKFKQAALVVHRPPSKTPPAPSK